MQNNSKKNKISNNKKGFSLIEMMVAVALFSVVMLMGVGALLSLIDANRKAHALNSVMNNLNFAVESMSRNLRVGTNYNCGSINGRDCSGETSIFFTPSVGGGEIWVYQYNSSEKRIEMSKNSGSSFIFITAPEVVIEKLEFYVTGSDPSDDFQPRARIIIQGTAGVKEKIKTNFNLQTMVSQRVLDL